ncbi:hypothetical protein GOODEAATRI_027118 [Goodea atripinnis]|uniref:Uncharacterized protein n=1 Tax=Goodea atripinnis TaxID=208336 RepID=A0ABV0MW95_9TELE
MTPPGGRRVEVQKPAAGSGCIQLTLKEQRMEISGDGDVCLAAEGQAKVDVTSAVWITVRTQRRRLRAKLRGGMTPISFPQKISEINFISSMCSSHVFQQ